MKNHHIDYFDFEVFFNAIESNNNHDLILCFLIDIFMSVRKESKRFVIFEHPKSQITFTLPPTINKCKSVPEIKLCHAPNVFPLAISTSRRIIENKEPKQEKEKPEKVQQQEIPKMPQSARLMHRQYTRPLSRKEIQLKRTRFSPR